MFLNEFYLKNFMTYSTYGISEAGCAPGMKRTSGFNLAKIRKEDFLDRDNLNDITHRQTLDNMVRNFNQGSHLAQGITEDAAVCKIEEYIGKHVLQERLRISGLGINKEGKAILLNA